MPELTTINNTIAPQMFTEYVSWIDRGEATTKTYLKNLKAFGSWMQETGHTRPEREDIISYRQYLTNKGLKPSTITGYIRAVKSFFKWTAANGIYPDIASTIRVPKVDHTTHKKDALKPSEVLDIEKSIQARAAEKTSNAAEADKDRVGRTQRAGEQAKRLYAMYLLAVTAGLRTVELHRANVGDLETRGGHTVLYVWGKGRTEPDQKKALADEVAAAIYDYLAIRADHPTAASPLFTATGNRNQGGRIATTTISTMLKRAMQEAGYNSDRLTAHSLRHTAGTAAYTITGNLYETQKYMRHSNPGTTEIYLHTNLEEKEGKTAQKLYNLYHAEQGTETF